MAVLSAEAVGPKIRELNGNLAAVGRHFGVDRSAVHRFVKGRPGLRAICHEARESMKDMAESALYKAVLAGEGWAVCFFLKTQAKDRGYVERQEIDTTRGVVLEVVTEIVDATPPPAPASVSPPCQAASLPQAGSLAEGLQDDTGLANGEGLPEFHTRPAGSPG